MSCKFCENGWMIYSDGFTVLQEKCWHCNGSGKKPKFFMVLCYGLWYYKWLGLIPIGISLLILV